MNGARATEDEFFDAIDAGDVARVRALLADDGVDVNTRHSLGPTPLHCAAKHGHADVVRLLLTRGAHVDARIRDT
ncbi:hypothetical protein PINS_up020166 [Pythium insidiosum]|nr:hypothetical protein PINS_up020166 [Pythium insidiosum]